MANEQEKSALEQLMACVQQRRDRETGRAWDQRQTFQSLAPHTLEEAYEVVDAIERDDAQAIKEELGDVLLQVVYHAQVAKDQQLFTLEQVAESVLQKLQRRSAQGWEHSKQAERAQQHPDDNSALAAIAMALPALMRAQKLQSRAARVGFDWDAAAPALAKVHEEIAEVEQAIQQPEHPHHVQEELGDVLFSLVNVIRLAGLDAESTLRAANAKFEQRFRGVEARVHDQGKSLSECELDELEAHWQAVKRQAKTAPL